MSNKLSTRLGKVQAVVVVASLLASFFVGFALPAGAVPLVQAPGDVVINEVDADTPSYDAEEFIELYDGGAGNTALNGLVVVLYNGYDDRSYSAFDLDGYTTDAEGYFVIGSVTGADIYVDPGSYGWLQNGADAVAIYTGDAAGFPNGTALTTDNLIDAIVYDTNDADDAGLLALLNAGQPQVNEDGAEDKDHHSNQRCPNGAGGALNTDTYTQVISTPGAANDCTIPIPDVVINEVDTDTPSYDDQEFIELYDGGAGNTALDGLAVVLYNGYDDRSYNAFDLDGYTTDAEGYFVIGSVTGADIYVDPGSYGWLQNGADAVAIYTGDAAGFPNGTALTTDNLIDAIVYDTNDADDAGLLALLNAGQPQVNEDGAGDKDHHSNQRCPNGAGGALNTDTYTQVISTPGAANDCAIPTPDVVINEFLADPAGDLAGDANGDGIRHYGDDEFVEIVNDSDSDVNISGWTLSDAISVRHTFPTGTVVPANCSIVVFGGGSPTGVFGGAVVQTASTGSLGLNNSGDTITLNDGSTDLLVVTYGSEGGDDQSLTRDPDVTGEFVKHSVATGSGGALFSPGTMIDGSSFAGCFACGDPATFIHDVQGNGSTSPLNGASGVVIEGVVVGDFQDTSTQLKGFYLQEEDTDADADPMTSESVFVYDYGFMDVNVGDVVRVMGNVTEYYGLTELNYVSKMAVCSSGASVTAATVELPVLSLDVWEQYEGMLINIPQTLYATGNYNQGHYGEVDLSVGDRLDTPTNVVLPGEDAIALQDLNDRSRIQLEDGSTVENPSTAPYIGDDNTLRAGDTIPGLTGVLSYGYGYYEVHPTEVVNFTRVNTRDASPDSVGGMVKVASFNVLNYFTTLDDSGSICGPSGDMDCRGADTADEFVRQRDKIIAAIVTMDADVIGLMEMENHPTDDALQDLVNGLNDATGAGTYAFVNTGPVGTDAIKVAFIYKPGTVTPVGSFAILDSSVDETFIDTKNRPALAQTFRHTTDDEVFTVVVNHLKSKGSDCNDLGDPDTGDGQGNCNLTRTSAATALANWLATDPTGSGDLDFLIIGDLNAYAMEDPITAIKDAGYTNLIESFVGADAYSYVFYGQAGYLDHALASPYLTPRVTGVTGWHINADEPSALNYNDYNQPYLYSPDAYASSDHDPVIVGFCSEVKVEMTPDTLWPPNHEYVIVHANIDHRTNPTLVSVTSNEPDDGLGDGDMPDDIVRVDDFTFKLRAERSGSGDGRIYTITYQATDACGNITLATATVTVPHDQG